MKLPRNLDAQALIRHLERKWSYEIVRQTGSHIRLRTTEPSPHAITVPNHTPLKTGTLANILKDIATNKGVPAEEILSGL